MAYTRFFAMIATSTVVMFGLMYLNTFLFEHIFFSETRSYMALLMGAVMAFIMLAFMLGMYDNRAVNIAIFTGSVVVFALTLWLVRSQVTVQDRSYMSAMIPHHSIAIMTSSRAEITDPRVRKMADEIIYAQDKEIAEMRFLIADIATNGEAASVPESGPAEIVSVSEALTSEVRATIDPGFMADGDGSTLFDAEPECRFTYTETSPPVFYAGTSNGEAAGLLKISGDLVQLSAPADPTSGGTFDADGLTVEITSAPDSMSDLHVRADGYDAAFRGFYSCAG